MKTGKTSPVGIPCCFSCCVSCGRSSWCAQHKTKWLRLRPAGSVEEAAPLFRRQISQRQIAHQAALSSGQPRPISRVGRAGRPHRPCLRRSVAPAPCACAPAPGRRRRPAPLPSPRIARRPCPEATWRSPASPPAAAFAPAPERPAPEESKAVESVTLDGGSLPRAPQPAAGRPVAQPLTRSAETARTARCALRSCSSQTGALPRWHFDPAAVPPAARSMQRSSRPQGL